MDQRVEKPKRTARQKPVTRRIYSQTFKLKAVKLHVEESIPLSLVSQETGVCVAVLSRWCRLYNREGESGLAPKPRTGRRQIHPAVKERIISLKKKSPGSGIRRIAQMLRWLFCLPGSHETVRTTLHEAGLMEAKSRQAEARNVKKVRRFERSKPNQMWQSDITMFRLGGVQVYLIGFIDDYSRYIVGLALYATQKAANVLEVYRQAMVEFGAPKEMLTDNGRQYTSWRGATQFEAQMKRDKVKHIKSQPHHPMTLGKIERFWETILQEFLFKAQFSSFEDARDRIRHWVQYYNHRRPHQGIEGLCPADRYFEVATELKKTIEQGIQDNVLELALKGKAEGPFYMVGRMRGQSVVLMAEKGKLKLRVDGQEQDGGEEIIYNLPEKGNINGGEHGEGKGEDPVTGVEVGDARCGVALPGGAVGVDGEQEACGGMPGAGGKVDDADALAEAGHGGDASGADAPCAAHAGEGASAEVIGHANAPGGALEVAAPGAVVGPAGPAIAKDTGETAGGRDVRRAGETLTEQESYEGGAGAIAEAEVEGSGAGADHSGSPEREADGEGGGGLVGYIEAALLRIGAPGTGCHVGSTPGQGGGAPGDAAGGGPGEGDAEAKASDAGTGGDGPPPDSVGAGSPVPVSGMAA